MDPETWSYEHKLLFNGLLFCALRSHDSVDEKLLNIEKYIGIGANINAQDLNDKCNTPLHVAVKLGEPEIVKFLLLNAANHNIKNQDLYTPVELARISHNESKHEVIAVLETYSNEIIDKNEKQKENTGGDIFKNKTEEKETNEPLTEQNTIQKYPDIEKNKQIKNGNDSKNENRSGSAGIGGHLFETKLLGLLLHRAIIDTDIDKFYLGANVSGLGAFDDIVFKYILKNDQKPVYIFVQAKHKENPENQENITVQSLTNRNSNNVFNIAKFFQSYLNVQKKFNKKSEKNMFSGDFKNVDCKFIIYTSALENFHKMKLVNIQTKDKLLITADKGKTFAYDYDDSDLANLLSQTLLATAKSLANSFATNIASQKSKKCKKRKNMMFDDFIRIYHIYLADNVVNIKINETDSNDNSGSFRNSFLTSSDHIFVLMRETIIKGLKNLDCFENLDSIKFNLPKTFGNTNISFDSDHKRTVEKLLEIKPCRKNTIEDENVIGILKKRDIKLLGDLVGSVFVLDKETDLLKFNTESSSNNIKEFLKKLNDFEYVQKLRFNITIQNFPQLSLIQHQRKVMMNFLDKIIFFTNQATEDKVENILKKELGKLYNSEANDSFFQIKVDAIYLFYHDSIQKWWKDSKKTNEFLDRSCQFYADAKKNIAMPLVNVLSYVYVQKLNGRKLYFEEDTLKLLKLHEFMTESERCLSIVTGDTLLTSIKVNIFFQNHLKTNNYKFISSEDIVEKAICDIILSETTELIDTIIFVLHDNDNTTNHNFQMVYEKIIENSKTKLNKVIIITRNKLFLNNSCEKIDNLNRLCDLDASIRQDIVQHKTIIYQGYRVPFKCIVDTTMHSLIKGKTLHKLIQNKSVEIGKKITNANKIKDIYLKRRLCRCLILSKVKYSKEFRVLYKNGVASAKNDKDILIISDDDKSFEKNVKKHPDNNIHWFKKTSENQIHWIQSHGSIKKLVQLVKKTSCIDNYCYFEPQKVSDLSDRVVIISADPGMGKSTILTHLSNQTKLSDKSLCIIKLNLIELENDFLSWQQCNSDFKLIWLLQLLYKSFSKGDNKLNMNNLFNNVTIVYGSRVIFAKDIDRDTNLSNEHELAFVELQVFFNAYNDDKIALVIDGFDEICPNYRIECIEIFRLLLISRVKYLWISTRPSLNLNDLEIELNTFSFSMVGFSKDEQIEFLQKFWKNYLYEKFSFEHPRPNEIIKMITEQFLNAVSHKIKDDGKYFSSIPLHLKMIAEVYKQHFSNYLRKTVEPQHRVLLNDAFNLINLYEKFIDLKFDKIRLSQMSSNFKDPVDRMNKLKARKSYVDDLKKLAAHIIFTKKASMLSKHDLNTIIPELKRSFILGEEKTGTVMLTQGKLEFVHRTFAEYFACEFLCDQIKGDTRRAWEIFINHILVMDVEGIRRFIDAKLETDQILSTSTSKYICDALLKQTLIKKSALHIAVLEERINIVTFLLNNVEKHIEMKQLDDFLTLLTKRFKKRCTLCEIYDRNINSAMKTTLDIIKGIDQNKLFKLLFCEDNPACNIFQIAFLFHDNTYRAQAVDIILSYTKSADIAKLFIQPIVKAPGYNLSNLVLCDKIFNYPLLHVLVQFTNKTQIFKHLKNLNERQCLAVLFAKDDLERTAAHWAARYDNYKFFEVMLEMVEVETVKKICTSKDKLGAIPLRCFGFVGAIIDWYRAMCVKIGIEIVFKKKGGWYLRDAENGTIW